MTVALPPQRALDRALKRYGSTSILRVTSTSAVDPNTGTAARSISDHTVRGVPYDVPASEIDGTAIRTGDLRFALSTTGLVVTPKTDHLLILGGATYRVLGAEPAWVSGQIIAYILTMRRV